MNPNEILGQYKTEDEEYLRNEILMLAYFGILEAPETDEEFKALCEKLLAEREKKITEAKAKAERKANNELVRAQAMKMTLEEYREYKKIVADKKRRENDLKKAKEQMVKLERTIKRNEKKLAEYEKKIKEVVERG